MNNEHLISDFTWLSDQSWYRERIVERGGNRLRFSVRCNAYAFQSYAEVSVWRDAWVKLHRIAGEQLKTKASYVTPDVKPEAFDGDIAELRRVADGVLGAPRALAQHTTPGFPAITAPPVGPLDASKRQAIPRVRCSHLASSEKPGARMSAAPCLDCGRYFIDDDMTDATLVDVIFEKVMTAIQPAEEISGPDGAQYVTLMERIAHEAQRRADRVREELSAP